MCAVRVEYHHMARKEYDDARAWYAERSESAAIHFKQAVDAAVRRIAQNPEALPRYSGFYRWARVREFP
jgi:plasmid stabilization system protein ParE